MRRTLTHLVAVAMVLLLNVLLSFAQQPTGTPQFNRFQPIPGGVINLGTLGVHLNVPVFSKAGRGTPMVANWNYDDEIWYVVNGYWETGIAPNYSPAIGYLGAQVSQGSPAKYVTTGNPWCQASQSYDTYLWSGFYYIDTFGTTHKFPNAALEYPTCGTVDQNASDTSADGYTLTASVNTSTWAVTSTVTAPDGTKFNGTSFTGTGTLTDRNGNQISVASPRSGVLQYTDTLNILALESTLSGGTTTYTYNGECGTLCESVTETTATFYIATAFSSGCSGTHDYVTSSTFPLPTQFALPDGSSYVIQWEQTPGKPLGYTTGRIGSITLSTGGKITFTYSGSNNGMNCDGTTSHMTMATPDGTWTYTHSAANGNNVATTTVTDPAGNLTNYNFYMNSSLGALEAQRQVYTGGSTLLYTDVICYNGQTTNCATSPNSLTTVSSIADTHIDSTNIQYKTVTGYDSHGRLTEEDDYDWGAGAPQASSYRQTLWVYGGYQTNGSCSEVAGNILDVLCKYIVYDTGNGGVTDTYSFYERDTKGNTTLAAEQVGTYSLYKQYTYNPDGTVATFTDVNGDQYSYTYGDCNGAFPTSISEPGGLSKSMTWDCNGGVLGKVTDEAGATTTIAHSGEYFWRPSSMSDALGNVTTFSYTPNSTESVLNFGSYTADKLVSVDGLGRVHVSQQRQGPGSSYFDTVETDYNADGLVSRVTVPWQGTAGQTSPGASATNYSYDGAGRVLTATDGGGGQISYGYAGPSVTKTVSGQPSGESTKQWAYGYNSRGWLRIVCEVTGNSADPNCNNGSTAHGYQTQYNYDAAGRIVSMTENILGTGQSRNWTYDELGRMLSETNPESGHTTYTYDSSQTGAGAGDLYTKQDANSVTITYTHGAFHRLLTANVGSSFCRNFLYDLANAHSGANYVNGRMAEASTTTCGSGSGGSASLVQTVSSTSCSGTSCTLSVAGTGANHLLTVVAGFASNVSIASVSGGGTWVCPSSAVAANGTALGSAACYVLGSSSGATSIVINLSGSPGGGIWVAEFREYNVSGTPSLDTAGAVSDSTCTSCAGASLSLNGSNDLIVQLMNPASTVSAVSSGWGDTDFPGPDYFGVADEIGTASGTAPTWTTTSGIATASALAFNLGSAGSVFTTEYFGYDADGHTTDLWESTPDSGGLYHVTDQYYPNSVVNTLVATNSSGSFFTGLPTITYLLDGEGRPTTVTAGSGQNPVTAASYYTTSGAGAAVGQLAGLTYGSGDSDNYQYDPNTGRMTQYQFSINGSNVTGALTWNANGTLQQLVITDPFNSGDAQTCNYTYDAIARLSKVDCGATWGQSFSYDAYGNLTKAVLPGDSGLNWQPGYDNSNKYQLSGVSYDSDGNLTNDTFHTYTWDAFGSLTSIDSNTQYHDALGRLVEWKDDSGTIYEVMYAPAGGKIGMMTGQTLAVGRIPLPGGAIASYGSGGLNNYAHADWLGSTRFSSYTNRTEKWDLAHAPYGEVYALAGGGAEFTFTGQFSDYGNTNTLWDFPMREYHSSQGRWISPDPAGVAAANPMNPQTWNRYAYVGDNPMSNADPTGLGPMDGIRIPLNIAPPTGGAGGVNSATQSSLAGLLDPGAAFINSAFQNFYAEIGQSNQIDQELARHESIINTGYDPELGINWNNVNYLGQANGQLNRLSGNAASVFGADTYNLDPATCDLIGGHCNFGFICNDWSVCGPGRYDDGLHVECAGGGYNCTSGQLWIHDDTVSPWTGQFTPLVLFTGNFWEHGFVDLIGGTFFVGAFSQ